MRYKWFKCASQFEAFLTHIYPRGAHKKGPVARNQIAKRIYGRALLWSTCEHVLLICDQCSNYTNCMQNLRRNTTTQVVKRDKKVQTIPHVGTRRFPSMEAAKKYLLCVGNHFVHSSPCVDHSKLTSQCPLTYEEWQLHQNPRLKVGGKTTTWVCRRRRRPPPRNPTPKPVDSHSPCTNEVKTEPKPKKRKRRAPAEYVGTLCPAWLSLVVQQNGEVIVRFSGEYIVQ